jgi:hypothetical protein
MDNVAPKRLWEHKDPNSTNTYAFKRHVESKFHLAFKDYEELRQWSIANINDFWEEVWHFTGINASKAFTKVNSESLVKHSLLLKSAGCGRQCLYVSPPPLLPRCEA